MYINPKGIPTGSYLSTIGGIVFYQERETNQDWKKRAERYLSASSPFSYETAFLRCNRGKNGQFTIIPRTEKFQKGSRVKRRYLYLS